MTATQQELLEDLTTLPDAAARLGLHRSTVNEMVKDGRLRGYRLGPHWYVRRSDLDVFAERYKRPKNAPRRRARVAQSFWTDEILRWLFLWHDATSSELQKVIDLHIGNIRKYLTIAESDDLVVRDEFGRWSLTTRGEERASALPTAGGPYSENHDLRT